MAIIEDAVGVKLFSADSQHVYQDRTKTIWTINAMLERLSLVYHLVLWTASLLAHDRDSSISLLLAAYGSHSFCLKRKRGENIGILDFLGFLLRVVKTGCTLVSLGLLGNQFGRGWDSSGPLLFCFAPLAGAYMLILVFIFHSPSFPYPLLSFLSLLRLVRDTAGCSPSSVCR